MNYIDFVVRNKHIESRHNSIIADNTDYVFRFTFLGKWTEFETKTVLMLREDGKFYRCDMKNGATSLMLPKFTSPLTLLIGVTAGSGEDEISTDRLLFNVRSSIRTGANEELEKPESGAEDFLAEYCRRYDELLLKLEALDNVYILPSVTSADAGKVLRVSAAGEWEAADGDGDRKPFVVTVTYGDNDTLTADKTHAEIVAAYAAGEQINAKIVNYPGVNAPCILPLYVNNSDLVFIFSGSGALDGRAMAMTAQDFNGSWSVSLTELATLGDIPSGGTDTSLGVTGAEVGQIIKIKAVDENGIPTEWEAADAASGGDGAEIDISRDPDLILEVSKAVVSLSISEINGQPINATEMVVLWEHPGGAAYVPNYFRFNNEVKNATDSSAALANFNLPANACPSSTTAAAIFCRVKKINNGTYRYEFSGLQQNVGTLTGLNPTVYGAPYRNNLIGETSIKEFYVYQASNIQEGCKVSVWVK